MGRGGEEEEEEEGGGGGGGVFLFCFVLFCFEFLIGF